MGTEKPVYNLPTINRFEDLIGHKVSQPVCSQLGRHDFHVGPSPAKGSVWDDAEVVPTRLGGAFRE